MAVRYTPEGDIITNRCPQCVREGLKSKFVVEGSELVTDKLKERYYDEEGEHHFHDPNLKVGEWSCSNNHTGTYNKFYLCCVRNCEYRTVYL